MQLKISKQALKFLGDLDAKQYKQVGSAVMSLLSNAAPHDSCILKGSKTGDRRIDIGEYRIIYAVDGDVIDVALIGKRNGDEIYKLWERLRK
ncbi:type II toxin-antitoxin system RelE family toxin [Herbaspirillum huttiense]|uniref:type II toxin-antitoxin system RelE family toxin n=1 Tax=Herbaspirillum huttiense TaxID=863372 RepID=UPI002176B693|nr:type II toxin-antitoxin system RelE/ParE family toxin [Herbaspirillum huttiense]UWE15193.1 type II toxin-antitoxin system RelE/ParE family toxin [Herbaspirillum huttiense]